MPYSYLATKRKLPFTLKTGLITVGWCYGSLMKSNDRREASVTKPLLKELAEREKADSKIVNPTVGSKPLPPPDLYQDSGGGYNLDFTFPQE